MGISSFLRVEHLSFSYPDALRPAHYALNDVSTRVDEGEYVSVVGPNGSGKTTLLKHLNALLLPSGGDVWVCGMNTRTRSRHRDIRRTMGMVFQNPSSQIVQTTVEEEVAFGPENLGVPPEELGGRVDNALEAVGLLSLRSRPCAHLSSGQKQLLAIAAALSMKPRCLLLDEATSMLDWSSKGRFLETVEGLHRKGMTIVSVTHDMDEASRADRVIVLSAGGVAMDGTPREVFTMRERLEELELVQPLPLRLSREIGERVPGFPPDCLTLLELADEVERRAASRRAGVRGSGGA